MAEWFRDTVGAVSGDWAARWDEIVKAVEIDEDGKKMKAIVACSEEGVKSMEMLGKEREGWKIMTPDHSTMHMRDFADTWNTLSDVGCNVLVISVDTLLTSPRLSAHRLVFAEPVHPSISITKIHECLAQVSCCNQVSNGDMDVDVSHSGLDVVWICVKGTVEEGFFEVVVRRMGKEMELLQRRNVEQTNEKWGLAMRGIGFSELKKWIGMSISGVVTEGEKVGMEEVQVYLKELGRKCREE
ncbi:hypothetical protein BC829DRAFT_80015 [Chytridium lagenaria]|nr:hypothetical protein BC829DRAFT_80015 [Chytridium lagenaria]